jgi:cell division septal protein FtsQ
VLFFLLTLYFLHWISYRPMMRIREVSVRGAMLQDPQEIANYALDALSDSSNHYIARDNIFAYPKEEIRAGVMRTFPRLQSARLGRSSLFGTTLIVNVDERAAYATWCAESQICYVFDEGGLIFAATDRSGKPELPYVFYGGIETDPVIGSVFLPEQLRGVLDLLQRMREARFIPVSMRVLDGQDYTIALSNGFTIKASFGQEIDTIVHNLELVSVSPALRGKEASLEYIDLRFGNRVYYKFRGVDEPTEENGG